MRPWRQLTKPEDIEVISPEGEVRSRVKAYYTGTMFTIDDMAVDIRPGDEIRRQLPNGNDEVFFVEDPKCFDGGFGKHCQVKISRRGAFPHRTRGHYINVSGNNARVTFGTDASTNTVNKHALFDDVRAALSRGVQDQAALSELSFQVSALEAAKTQHSFAQAYQKFVSSAADYVTLITPFLPGLAAIIPGLPHN